MPAELLRTLPSDSTEPVQLVCFHPVQIADLQRGIYVEPQCLAVDYEYESFLHEICVALGWQGGTIHQAIEEIKKLREAAESAGLRTTSASPKPCALCKSLQPCFALCKWNYIEYADLFEPCTASGEPASKEPE